MIINIVALEMLGDRMPKLGSGFASFYLRDLFFTENLDPREREEGEQSGGRELGRGSLLTDRFRFILMFLSDNKTKNDKKTNAKEYTLYSLTGLESSLI